MEITNKDLVFLDINLDSQADIIDKLCDALVSSGHLNDKQKFIDDVSSREKDVTAAIGMDIAVPHAKSCAVNNAGISVLRLNKAVKWGAEKRDAKIIFMIAAPEGDEDLHLDILRELFRKFIAKDTRNTILTCDSADEICSIVNGISL